jgi:hypothetical protein
MSIAVPVLIVKALREIISVIVPNDNEYRVFHERSDMQRILAIGGGGFMMTLSATLID